MRSSSSVALRSWRDGFGRVLAAPAIVAAVLAVTLAAALPFALALRRQLETHLGSSLAAVQAAEHANWDWWQEFLSQAGGLGATFTPSVIGGAATLHSVSGVLDGQREAFPIMAAVAAYLTVWLFVTGGILDRYARHRPIGAAGFFAASGVYFWRLLRLGALAALLYWGLFGYVHGQLFDEWYDDRTRDLAVEQTAFLWRLAFYGLFGALLIAVNLIVDLAKVRMVVEDRRSAVWALWSAIGFLRRYPGRTIGLYALNSVTFLALVAVWVAVAPGAGGAGWAMWAGVAATQLYILARLVLKLQFMASEVSLFQGSLAHARFTARPAHVWPESPVAEAVSAPAPASVSQGIP